jgi:hypothetical protein
MLIRKLIGLVRVAGVLFAFVVASPVAAQKTEGEDFNAYILKSVEVLNKSYAAKGYGQSSYTHAMTYGPSQPGKPAYVIKPTNRPYTMCVAAVAEIIVTALNIYMADERTDPKMVSRVLSDLPGQGWVRMRPRDIRSHIWGDKHLKAWGTADALSTFGIGRHARFSELRPGAFVNVNRLNKSGHAVVFLGYIDGKGNDLAVYGPEVAGFRYFSSQGVDHAPGSGFGYRWAFFNQNGAKYCPAIGKGRKVDCGIIYSTDEVMLNTGYMLLPAYWDTAYRDRSLKAIADRIYAQNYSKGTADLGLPADLTREQFFKALDNTDTMKLNPAYANQDMPDD